jgi:hypothetical protein
MTAETVHVPDRRRTQILIAGLFLAPSAWALQLLISYSLTPTVCDNDDQTWWLHLVSLLAALTALGGAFLARIAWTRLTSGSSLEGDAYASSRRFLALTGMILSLFFVLVIAALDLPTWWLNACQR